MTVLKLQNIYKRYGNSRHGIYGLKNVSLEVEPGEFIIVEGPSGAGKTTLLTVSAGLLQPESGEVLLGGNNLQQINRGACRKLRAKHTGFLFQQANLASELTVEENITLMAFIANLSKKEAALETRRLLKTLGIESLATRKPATLSGGEEQRAALARALVHKPSIVFADEPTGNLDSVSGKEVGKLLMESAKSQDTAVIVATHDARLSPFADRILQMEDGIAT